MEKYRCLCGQPLALFVVAPMPLPVANAYVRRAVAAALVAHLSTVDRIADAELGVVHGVVADSHSDGEPWVLDAVPVVSGSR